MRICVFGGQYGSEGKGSLAEFMAKDWRVKGRELVAIGENSPNSGHTCSLGKTRNLPACAYFADSVIMGPDSAINPEVLLDDLASIAKVRGNDNVPRVYIHEHAALVRDGADSNIEKESGVISRISSTGSGSGAARAYRKCFRRDPDAVIRDVKFATDDVVIFNRQQYLEAIRQIVREESDCILECSQGAMLDVNWGIYPYVTSRTTMPRVAVERNALHMLGLHYAGVFRTFPIRTGGPSGPTGGQEITFADIGVEDEIATVTKRVRRVFEFSADDFRMSLTLNRPSILAFTHLDYLSIEPEDIGGFLEWLAESTNGQVGWQVETLLLSGKLGQFINHGSVMI